MRKVFALNYLLDSRRIPLSDDVVQSLRYSGAALARYSRPDPAHPHIQQALRRARFVYHRACSGADLTQERGVDVCEDEALTTLWDRELATSRASTMSACSSSLRSPASGASSELARARETMRSTSQQTVISCRCSPVNVNEGETGATEPASAGGARSLFILGSVCALLLNRRAAVAQGEKEPGARAGSRGSDNICRICFGGESSERLVRPCSCRGTIAAVHRSCLERWLQQASISYCELCRHHYLVTRSRKWSWARSLLEWARSGRGRALVADAWRGAVLGAVSVLGTARALHACDRALQAAARSGGGAALVANLFSSLLIGIIGALNGLLTTWILLKIQEHRLSWQAWRDSTLHIHVMLEDEDDAGRAADEGAGPGAVLDRSTNVADPFMVAPPDT